MNTAPMYDIASPRRELAILSGQVVLDGSSVPVVATSDSPKLCRFVVTRTGAGTYQVALQDKWKKLLGCFINVKPAGGTYAATDGYFGPSPILADTVATDGKFTVQAYRPDTGAAAEVEASSTLLVTVFLGNSE